MAVVFHGNSIATTKATDLAKMAFKDNGHTYILLEQFIPLYHVWFGG